ncbi:MAG TPA: hypothetical protein DDW52_24070 [Planctomycetaceae bacterium]|nr:hypothetical protein [Planctomycetaceae bacterium]
MAKRHLPVRPNLSQLKSQAKDLLRDFRERLADAVEEFREFHPEIQDSGEVKLADAQLVLARSYGVRSWPRLVQACRMIDAIHKNDLAAIQDLITSHPDLLHEDARGVRGNWGPPMSYAANLGRDEIIQMLARAGAKDVQHAFDHACLQGQVETARWLFEHGASLERGIVMGACETQNAAGLELLLELGAELCDAEGNQMAAVAMLLETYCRNPHGKHRCLELVESQGIDLPETPVMALHRGRVDLIDAFVRRDPDVLHKTFTYREIYPLEMGCHEDESLGLHGTTIDGTTLLHMCVDFDEMEIASWLLDNGADANATAQVDAAGYGGHTPLFNAVVSQANTCGRQQDASMTKLLLSHGADPTMRASLRKRLRFVEDESEHFYQDVTPLSYGQAFHEKRWTSRAAMQLLAEAMDNR